MANRSKASRSGQDADSRVPPYLRVASVLRRRIRDAHWAVGCRIATLEQLEREFGVARVTVRQAIALLQREGLLKSFQGCGTFVTRAPANDRWLRLATDWESLIAPIRDNVPEILYGGAAPPPRIEEGDGIAAPGYVLSAASRSAPAGLTPTRACISPSTCMPRLRSCFPAASPWRCSRR
jgi:GntR family transcriptional regulator